MKFLKGQDVTYIALSGRSYTATVIERKMDFKKGLIIKSTTKERDFHYLIEIQKNGIKENILCAENQLKILECKKRMKKKSGLKVACKCFDFFYCKFWCFFVRLSFALKYIVFSRLSLFYKKEKASENRSFFV